MPNRYYIFTKLVTIFMITFSSNISNTFNSFNQIPNNDIYSKYLVQNKNTLFRFSILKNTVHKILLKGFLRLNLYPFAVLLIEKIFSVAFKNLVSLL